jgi:hypothetical protein
MGQTAYYHVRIKDMDKEREFRDFCYRNKLPVSNVIRSLIDRYMKEQRPKPKATANLPALEDYLTSQRQAFKKRDQERDLAWKNARTAPSRSK